MANKVKKMRFQATLKKIGDSLFILVNREAKNILKLKEDDIVDVDLSKSEQVVEIICPECNCIFSDTMKDVYNCPGCNRDILSYEVKSLEEF